MEQNLELELKDKIVNVKIHLFNDDEDIKAETLLRIDIVNLLSEIVTFPVILNKFGILLSEMDKKVSEKKLELEIFEAKEKEVIVQKILDAKQKPTNDRVDDTLKSTGNYRVKKTMLIKAVKERDYINSIYWAMKEKSDLLKKLSMTLREGDVDISLVQESFNGVQILKKKKTI